jgi:thiamine biosynthesis lipoprotein
MTDGAVATSGDYRNYFEIDGKRYSHTIDPQSGYPTIHNLTSVSVIADSCAEADAWATAMMVLGHKKGLELANALDLAVYMVLNEGQTLKFTNSKAFEAYKDQNSEITSAKEI